MNLLELLVIGWGPDQNNRRAWRGYLPISALQFSFYSCNSSYSEC